MAAAQRDSYFVLAERASKSANILFREDQMEDATVHVHQIVERVARALLTHANIPFGTSHNLGQMAEALPVGHRFRDRIKGFDDLSSALTAYRYPTIAGRLKGPPAVDALRKKLEAAEQLLRDACVFVYGADEKLWPTEPSTNKSGPR